MRRAVVLLLAATACGDSLSPSEREAQKWLGDWVAESVGGNSLPATTITFRDGARWVAYERLLHVSPVHEGLGFSGSWRDSTVEIEPLGHPGAPTLNFSKFVLIDWSADGTVLHVGPCSAALCRSGDFFQRDFTLRADGKLEARIDASDGPITVFRKQAP